MIRIVCRIGLVGLIALSCGCGGINKRQASAADQGGYDAGKDYVEQTLQAARDGRPNPSFENFLLLQTQMKAGGGDYRAAVHTAEPLVQYSEIVYGPESLETGAGLEMLADVYCNLKRCAESIPLLERASAIYRQGGEASAVAYIRAMNSLGATWMEGQRPDRAEPILLESLALSEQKFGRESQEVGIVCWLLATTYGAAGKTAEASAAKTRAEKLLPANARF